MRKIYITVFILIILLTAQTLQADTDYLFFGEDRPFIAGLELMNSIYAINPAKTAEAVHNSLSIAMLLFPFQLGSDVNPLGQYYSLTIPNFSMVNITQTSSVRSAGGEDSEIIKDLLGLQLGLALDDFISTSSFKMAAGISLYKFREILLGDPASTSQSINMDLGMTMSLFGFSLEALVKNLITINENDSLFSGWDLVFSLGSKVILDVDFVLGLATGNNYDLFGEGESIDWIAELNFIRYFLSNSLRTGVGLETFIDVDAATDKIPVVRYHISVCYTPLNEVPERLNQESLESLGDEISRPMNLFMSLVQNMTFSFGTTMLVNSIPENESLVAALALGVTKFY